MSTRVNKTTVDGKVFISGDHNEVVVSTARETKFALAEIKTKLQSLSTKYEELTRKLQVLDERILPQGKLDTINKTTNNCFKKIKSLEENLEKKLDLVNKSNAKLSLRIQEMSQTLQSALDKQGIYLSNKPFFMGLPAQQPQAGCWENTREACKSRAFRRVTLFLSICVYSFLVKVLRCNCKIYFSKQTPS